MKHKFSIFNFQFSGSQKGFTLVELLAVMMVIGVVGGIVGAILISTLVGTNKTNSLDNVRQNGNYALLQMSKSIEFSRNFNGVSTDGLSYITDCTGSSGTAYQYIRIVSSNGQPVTFACGPSSNIASNGASLINTDSVSVSSCAISCAQDSLTVPPTIGITFTLTDKKVSNFVENKTSVTFNTSTTLRNLNR